MLRCVVFAALGPYVIFRTLRDDSRYWCGASFVSEFSRAFKGDIDIDEDEGGDASRAMGGEPGFMAEADGDAAKRLREVARKISARMGC